MLGFTFGINIAANAFDIFVVKCETNRDLFKFVADNTPERNGIKHHHAIQRPLFSSNQKFTWYNFGNPGSHLLILNSTSIQAKIE